MKGLLLVIALGGMLALSLAAVTLVIHRSPALEATDAMPCADLDGDGVVTTVDVFIEESYFGQDVPPAPAQADMNGNTHIQPDDISYVVNQFLVKTACQDKPIGPKFLVDTQINITVTDSVTSELLPNTCWLVSVLDVVPVTNIVVNNPVDVVSDNNAKVAACDSLGPYKADLTDKDSAVGSIRITIGGALLATYGGVWHVQQVQAPSGYNNDTAKHNCMLDFVKLKCDIPVGDVFRGVPNCADLDGDGGVTLADLFIETDQFGHNDNDGNPGLPPYAPGYKPQADLAPKTPNGLINSNDILFVANQFGTTTTCQVKPISRKGTAPPPPTPGSEMSLTVSPGSSFCDVPAKPTKCTVARGSPFTLSVEVNATPAAGYVGFQTQVDYGSLVYKPAANVASEVVWPGVSTRARSQSGMMVNHATASGGTPTLTVSTYTGNIVDLQLTCPVSGDSFTVTLPLYAAGTNPFGTTFFTGNYWTRVLPDTVATLNINCVTASPNDDTDHDGCTNGREMVLGANAEKLGGNRNPNNFWDYFDTPNPSNVRDHIIRVDDVTRVVNRYRKDDANGTAAINRNSDPLSMPPATGYHPAFDRTVVGPHVWNLGPPSGKIDVADVVAVVNQYRNDCV